jgi:hypothetical protein
MIIDPVFMYNLNAMSELQPWIAFNIDYVLERFWYADTGEK